MTIEKLITLAKKKPKNGRWLGVDLGSKTLGLAVTDPNLIIATPLKTLPRIKFSKDLPNLQRVIVEHNVSSFVFGLPTNMNGEEGRRANGYRAASARSRADSVWRGARSPRYRRGESARCCARRSGTGPSGGRSGTCANRSARLPGCVVQEATRNSPGETLRTETLEQNPK